MSICNKYSVRTVAAVSYTNYRQQRRTLMADHVIIAKEAQGDLTLAKEFRSSGFKVASNGVVGFAWLAVGLIYQAVLTRGFQKPLQPVLTSQ